MLSNLSRNTAAWLVYLVILIVSMLIIPTPNKRTCNYITDPEPSIPAPMTPLWVELCQYCSRIMWQVITLLRNYPNHVLRCWMPPGGDTKHNFVVYNIATDQAVLRVRDSTFRALRGMDLLQRGKHGYSTTNVHIMYQDYNIVAEPNREAVEGRRSRKRRAERLIQEFST